MGCLRKLGCLVVLLALAAAWFTRAHWWPPGRERAVASRDPVWQPLTAEAAKRGEAAIQHLREPNGPVFVNVTAAELGAYIFQSLSNTLPPSADSVEAAVVGDQLHVRALVRTSDLGARDSFGPLAMLLGERERVQMAGVLRVLRPGLAEFQVKEFKVRDFALPSGLIPRLIQQVSRRERPAELAPDALPLNAPLYIADIRIANGQVTLYKTVAGER